MADNSDAILGTLVASASAAIAWMAKKLYDSPRPDDYARLQKENSELKTQIATSVDKALAEARQTAEQRNVENGKLRDEIESLRRAVHSRATAGGSHSLARPRVSRRTHRISQRGEHKIG